MRSLLFLANFLAVAPSAVFAHGPDLEPRVGLKSEAVVRNEMRQLGVDVGAVTLRERAAQIEATVDGQPVVVEVDRMGAGAEVVSGEAAAVAALAARLQQAPAVLAPLPAPEAPRATIPVERVIRTDRLNRDILVVPNPPR